MLSSISVTPSAVTIPKGAVQQFAASGIYSDGSVRDLSVYVSWSSSPASIISIDAKGLARSVAEGGATVTASYSTETGSTPVTGGPAALVSMQITPNPLLESVGLNFQLTVLGTYTDGTIADLIGSASWSSSSPQVATVAGGVVSGITIGSTTISASDGTASSIVPVTVTTNAWSLLQNMPFTIWGQTATLLTNGKVLVAGGSTSNPGSDALALCIVYDPANSTWRQAASMHTARKYHTATLLGNGNVLVTGGADPSFVPESTAEIYDSTTNTWRDISDMNFARAFHTASLLPDGRVLIVGSVGVATAELFDPIAESWSQAANMTTARRYHTATVLKNGKLLVAGGSTIGSAFDFLANAELYDPVKNTWTSAGSTSVAASGRTATLLDNGKVLLTGGEGASVVGYAVTELYDPVTNAWSTTGSLSTPRTSHSAVALADGKVLVAGGFFKADANSRVVRHVEIYNSLIGTWSAGPDMNKSRFDFSLLRLASGALLAVGGESHYLSNDVLTSSSELYY